MKLKVVSFMLLLAGCQNQQTAPNKQVSPKSETNNAMVVSDSGNYEVKVFASDTSGFGYDVYHNNKIAVHQPFIPGVNGNKGFATAIDALKVGQLVAKKLQKNILPPSVSTNELDSLGVKK
jgi:Domain of unknown function (DUF4907)